MTSTLLGWNSGANILNVTSNNFASYSNFNSGLDSSTNEVVWTGTRWFTNYYRFSTNGTTWTSSGMSVGTYGTFALGMAIVGGQLHIMAGKAGGGYNYYTSSNEGSTWTLKNTFTTSQFGNYVNRLRILSSSDGTSIVIVNPNNHLTKIGFSSDSGTTWTFYSDTTAGAATRYFLLNGRLYRYVAANTAMTFTTNNGASWTTCTDSDGGTNPTMRWYTENQISCASDTNAVMGGEMDLGYAARYTVNGGVSWHNVAGITTTGSSRVNRIHIVIWNGSTYIGVVECRLPATGTVVWYDVYTSPTGATWTYQRTIGGTPGTNANNILGGMIRLSTNYIATPLATQIAAIRTTHASTTSAKSTKVATALTQFVAIQSAQQTILDPDATTTAATLTSTAQTYVTGNTTLQQTYVDLAATLATSKANLSSALTILGQ
jgi:hypothetical protein